MTGSRRHDRTMQPHVRRGIVMMMLCVMTSLVLHAHAEAAAAATAVGDSPLTLDLAGVKVVAVHNAYGGGATLHPNASDSHGAPAQRVRWSLPSLPLVSGESPLLLHTLFAEWRPLSSTQTRTRDSTHSRTQYQRVCTHVTGIECVVAAGVLPLHVDISLSLLTECDYRQMALLGRVVPYQCLTTMSPPTHIYLHAPPKPLLHSRSRQEDIVAQMLSRRVGLMATIPPPPEPRQPPVRASEKPSSTPPIPASTGDKEKQSPPPPPHPPQLCAVDPRVRQALCDFFTLTGGKWYSSYGWCESNAVLYPVCGSLFQEPWWGVRCDTFNSTVLELHLSTNGIALPDPSATAPGGVGINALWEHLPSLRVLDLSNNGWMGPLDLSPLTALTHLTLGGWVTSPVPMSVAPVQTLGLPSSPPGASSLVYLDVSNCALAVSLSPLPNLQILYAQANSAPWALADLAGVPRLAEARFAGSKLGSAGGGSRSGGVSTQQFFANMNVTNPALNVLDLTNTPLDFGQPPLGSPYGNFPLLNAPNLTQLLLSQLPQLRTSSLGPDPHWLRGLPLLTLLDLSELSHVYINCTAFAQGYAPGIQWLYLASTQVVGTLNSLYALRGLVGLVLDDTGISSSLPGMISAVWPSLEILSAMRCRIHGPIPSFVNACPTTIFLNDNLLTGVLPPNFLAGCAGKTRVVCINNNALGGTLPQWDLPLLTQLNFAGMLLSGSIPPNWWDSMPMLQNIDLSLNDFTGPIPSPAAPRYFAIFALPGNSFSGPLPSNLSAAYFDVSQNALSGNVSVLHDSPAHPSITRLKLFGNPGLNCPVHLASLTSLTQLELQNGGFSCDFTNYASVQLPESLTYLDISHNAWTSMSIQLLPNLLTLRAQNASIHAVTGQQNLLTTALLDDNALRPDLQLVSMKSLPLSLMTLSCQRCGLQLTTAQMFRALGGPGSRLTVVRLAQNAIAGSMPSSCFAWTAGEELGSNGVYVYVPTFSQTIQVIDVSGNTGITGTLPPAGVGYTDLTSLNLGNTSVSGPIPESWSRFTGLNQLNLASTNVRCPLAQRPNGTVWCPLPSWLVPLPTLVQEVASPSLPASPASSDEMREAAADAAAGAGGGAVSGGSGDAPTTFVTGLHCQTLGRANNIYSGGIDVDPSYAAHTLCTCDTAYFGKDGHCLKCPQGCTCKNDVVQNCYPVIELGSFDSASGPNSTGVQVITPFVLTQILPCPQTLTGESLCNPRGMPWPQFYQVPPSDILPPSNVSAGGDEGGDGGDGGEWCYPGHQGRLCAACSTGYFSSGRWCLKCLPGGVHVLILMCNLGLGLFLVAYLYLLVPGMASTQTALRRYFTDGYFSDARRLQRRAIAAATTRPNAALSLAMPISVGALESNSINGVGGGGGGGGGGGPEGGGASDGGGSSVASSFIPPRSSGIGLIGSLSRMVVPIDRSDPLHDLPGRSYLESDASFLHASSFSFNPAGGLSMMNSRSGGAMGGSMGMGASTGMGMGMGMGGGIGSPGMGFGSLASQIQQHRSQPDDDQHESYAMRTLAIDGSPVDRSVPSSPLPFLRTEEPLTPLAIDRELRNAEVDLSSASPLRLLVFHVQQLSLLLITATSLPSALAGLLAVFSSGGNGFSFSSLTAMECLDAAWSLQHKCWAALFGPLLICIVAALTWVRSRVYARHSHALNPFNSVNVTALRVASELQAARIYSVCVACMYLLFFPCAQASLSALSCTDRRELVDGRPHRIYLNQAPWQQCDQHWRSTILPPALLAALLWCIVFPVVSTIILRRLHTRLAKAGPARSDSSTHLHTWSLVSDLLKPYMPRLWYWEQVLLARRLALVACVTIVPSSSLYQPLILFAIMQLSALLQLWARPYRSTWLNRGELFSLYILLLTYISALVNQSSSSDRNSTQGSDSMWIVSLFIANLLFLLVLVASLFGWTRGMIVARKDEIKAAWARLTGGGGNGNNNNNSNSNPNGTHSPAPPTTGDSPAAAARTSSTAPPNDEEAKHGGGSGGDGERPYDAASVASQRARAVSSAMPPPPTLSAVPASTPFSALAAARRAEQQQLHAPSAVRTLVADINIITSMSDTQQQQDELKQPLL